MNWISGKYPERLYKALMNSSTVLTVWDEKKLIGLTRVLDVSEMLAQIHYVLVDPDYQGMGIAGKMIEYIKEKYKDFLYIDGMSEELYINVLDISLKSSSLIKTVAVPVLL